MNIERLSDRLNRVAQYITDYASQPIRLADIGSDHAYLPCFLVKTGAVQSAVAGEVVEGPYQSALAQVKASQLEDQIQVRLGDGFEAVHASDQINAATICGMGGGLIVSILEAAYQAQKLPPLLVLQANTAVANVRVWLQDHSYQLLDESFIEEKGQVYEIIVARKTDQPTQYSPDQLLFGPIHLEKPGPIYLEYWERELKHHQFILEQLQLDQPLKEMSADRQSKIDFMQNHIARIERMLDHVQP